MKNKYTFYSSRPRLIGRWLLLLVAMLCTATLQIVNAQVSVTATAGTTGPSTYTTVSAAFAAINAGTHQGDVRIRIVSNTSEPGSPTALAASSSPSNYTSVRIEPFGGNYTIGGTITANRAIIELNGADNVTIDGDDPSVAGTRNLTIGFSTTAATIAACIRVSSASTIGANGATNNTIRNCIITGNRVSTGTTATYGINMSNYSTTSLSTGGYSSINNRFENNLITRCYHGIWAVGTSSTYPNTGLRIVNNVLGDNTSAGNIGNRGIIMSYTATSEAQSATVSGNEVVGIGDPGTTGYSASIVGLEIGTANFGAKIFNNYIHDVKQPSTSGYGAYGVLFSGSTSCDSIRFYNNIITRITASNFTTTSLSSFTNYGVKMSAGPVFGDFSNNTIVMNTPNPTGTTANPVSYALSCDVNGVRFVRFRNNIIVNTLASTNAVGIYTNSSAIYTSTNYSGGQIWDRNCYWVPTGVLGFSAAATPQATISAWKAATGKDGSSFNVNPNFVSATDLHLNGLVASLLESGGLETSFNTDFDGQPRPGPAGSVNGGGTSFDIGADEYDGIPIVPVSITSATATASSCTAIAHTVTATVVQGTNPITSVTLSYTLNGVTQSPISMTNTSGSTWEGTIPVASPTNATIAWTVSATDGIVTPTATGSYQDDALNSIGFNTFATPSSVCIGSNSSLSATVYNAIAAPTTYTVQQVTNPTTDEDLGNVTITDAATSTVLLNNTTTYNSLVGTIGTAAGNAGSYSSFLSFGPYPMTAGSSYNFSLSSLQSTTAYPNAMAIYIDLNRDGDYTDAGEAVFNETATSTGARTITGSFILPATANNGLTRMRVMINEGLITSPTMTISYGEREEYMINISSSNNGGGGNIPTFTWSWSNGSSIVGTTNPLSTAVPANTTFTVTGTTSAGCTLTASVTPSTIPLPSAPTATNSVQCGAGIPTAAVSSTTGLPTPTFRWYADQSGGTALQNSVSTSYGTSVSATDTLWVSEFDGSCESSRTPVIVTVNTPPAITTSASTTICSGQSTTLTVSSSNPGYSYTWNNAAGSGSSVTVSPMSTTTYTVTAFDSTTGQSNSGCIITAFTTITVITSPTAVTIIPSDTTICEGASVTLNTTGGINSGVYQQGNQSTVNGTTGYPATLSTYYGGVKHQMLFTAAELTTLGYTANDKITSLGFSVHAVGSTFSGTLNSYSIAIKHTTASLLTTTFETGLTQVAYLNWAIPTTGLPTWTTVNFNTPFVWDGTSNLIIQTSFSNEISGTSTDFVQTHMSNTGSTVCSWYRADATSASAILGATSATGTSTNRPDVRLGWERNSSFYWSPNTSASTAPSVTPSTTTTYSVVATNSAGCTSTRTVTVNVIPRTRDTTTASACDSYIWSVNGTTYTTGGIYSVINGCNTSILVLTITPSGTNTTTASACDSYTWSVNGQTYSSSGTYSSVSGCNTEILVLTITPSGTNTTTASACDSYTWSVDGQTYSSSGTYSSVSGCNTEILVLTITPSGTNTTTASACDSYTWSVDGNTFTQSGIYSSVSGCSTEILVLTITPSGTNTTTASACDSYTWSVNGQTYSSSGTYSSVSGCNTEILVLTITPSGTNTTTASACDSYTWSVDGNTFTQSGIYSSVSGCNTEILVLTITPSGTNTTTASACDSYTWSVNGQTYSSSGTYSSVSGCNTEILVLTITPSGTNTTTASACDSYTWSVDGQTYSSSGTYSSVSGCNTEILVLTITPSETNTTTASACDSYTWSVDGNTFTQSGIYSSVSGCSTEILVLTITPSGTNTTTASACDSYTWSVNGQTYSSSGTYSSVSGCNTEILVLTITPSGTNTTTASACDSYTWSVDGQTYSSSGTYSSVSGCNTEILVLTITPSGTNTTTASACDSYTWSVNGQTYSSSGTYSSVSGCNTEILVLTITPSETNTTTASACDSYTWSVNGQTYSSSGIYSSVSGCNTEILVLTITPSETNTTTTSACDSYTWSVDGQTYSSSGTYSSVSGCNTEILVLTITPQAAQPTLACYESATFNSTTCSWDIMGSQPAQPSLACYENATFNITTCSWDVAGSQPAQPSLACYETATFNGMTCQWDVSGAQPAQPSLACYENATFNTTTCSWEVAGSQPAQPSLACYETATFNGMTCQWDVSGAQPAQPSLACYENATFNTTTCSWEVAGSQPAQPSLACYETTTFNSMTCQWDVTGTQPAQPTGLASWQTATFNTTTCQWDVSGTPLGAPVGGTVVYGNSVSSPMRNAVVLLKQGSTEVARDTTDAAGAFLMPLVAAGNYTVVVTPNTPWGGVNATDAVLIINHYSNRIQLSGIRLTAADVNGSQALNATDALNIMQRFTGGLSTFTVGNYAASTSSYSASGTGTGSLNVSMLCYGDVNASYQPNGGFVRTSWKDLSTQGVARITSGSYEVPLFVSRGVQPAGVSLELELPQGIRVLGIRVSEGLSSNQVVYHQEGNRVRIAWLDESGAELKAGEVLCYVQVEGSTEGVWRSSTEVELANVLGEVQSGVELRMPKLSSSLSALEASVYPNPGRGMRTLELGLSEGMKVVVRVTDALGRTVYTHTAGTLASGTHRMELNMEGWPAGSYQVQVLGATAEGKAHQRSITVMQMR